MLPTLLIVDDERATREGLRTALEEEFDIEVQFNSNSPAEGDIDISSVASIVLAVEKMVAEQA